MSHPTPERLIDRTEQSEKIDETLERVADDELRFKGLELFGLAGSGKSRLLETAMAKAKQRGFLVILLDCVNDNQLDDFQIKRLLLKSICDQLVNLVDIKAAREAIPLTAEAYTPRFARAQSAAEQADPLAAFRQALVKAIGARPLALFIEQSEQCPDAVFDWLGSDFIAPLVETHALPALVLFVAGRSQRIPRTNRWQIALRERVTTMRLDALNFTYTTEHLQELPPDGGYSAAAGVLYDLSNGHPYSTEALVEILHEHQVPVDRVALFHEKLADQLYELVLKQYIFRGADDWVLPLLEAASVPRLLEPALLKGLVQRLHPELAPNQPIQWFRIRLQNLQDSEFHLVHFERNQVSPELMPPLRRLLHAAMVVRQPRDLFELHGLALEYYQEELRKHSTGNGTRVAYIQEIIFHLAQRRAIQKQLLPATPGLGGASGAPQKTLAQELHAQLEAHFNRENPADVETLHTLRKLLPSDSDLELLIGQRALLELEEELVDFLQPPSAPRGAGTSPFQESFLIIYFSEPSEFKVSWHLHDHIVLTTQTVYSARRFEESDWRKRTREIGQVAFGLYLPEQAQGMIKEHRQWSIQFTTDTTHIPWELLHDGEEFVCLAHPVARIPSSVTEPHMHPPRNHAPKRALVIGNPSGDLYGAGEEAETIARLLREHDVEVELLRGPHEASANEFAIRIARPQHYDLIHFAGHGVFNSRDPRQSYLEFTDGAFLAEELRALKSRAFVFLSACYGSRGATQDVTFGPIGKFMDGLAMRALMAGAAGCLGPLWAVDDYLAGEFAVMFYEKLLSGLTTGEAVMAARQAVRAKSAQSDLWASWVLYGKPLQTIF